LKTRNESLVRDPKSKAGKDIGQGNVIATYALKA